MPPSVSAIPVATTHSAPSPPSSTARAIGSIVARDDSLDQRMKASGLPRPETRISWTGSLSIATASIGIGWKAKPRPSASAPKFLGATSRVSCPRAASAAANATVGCTSPREPDATMQTFIALPRRQSEAPAKVAEGAAPEVLSAAPPADASAERRHQYQPPGRNAATFHRLDQCDRRRGRAHIAVFLHSQIHLVRVGTGALRDCV